jgi:hypothetical protein
VEALAYLSMNVETARSGEEGEGGPGKDKWPFSGSYGSTHKKLGANGRGRCKLHNITEEYVQ